MRKEDTTNELLEIGEARELILGTKVPEQADDSGFISNDNFEEE